MKLFIITTASLDDDGNFYSEVHKVCKTEQEAIDEVRRYHEQVLTYFDNPDSDYDDGDKGFDVCEEDDIGIRQYCQIEEVEIN